MDNTIEVKPGLYEHFKGGRAIVFAVCTHSEAHHLKLVHYQEVGDDGPKDEHWVRPLDMFTQRIIRDGYDGPRFWRIGTWEEAISLLGSEPAEVVEAVVGDGANDPVEPKPVYPQQPATPTKRIHDASVR